MSDQVEIRRELDALESYLNEAYARFKQTCTSAKSDLAHLDDEKVDQVHQSHEAYMQVAQTIYERLGEMIVTLQETGDG